MLESTGPTRDASPSAGRCDERVYSSRLIRSILRDALLGFSDRSYRACRKGAVFETLNDLAIDVRDHRGECRGLLMQVEALTRRLKELGGARIVAEEDLGD